MPVTTHGIDLNPEFRQALRIMEKSDKHLLLTGRAGTGKSTLLTYFRERTDKNAAVLAPTGVAALNVDGQTVHSFFGFKPDITVDKVKKARGGALYRNLNAVVIDEISMVRADLMDCVDAFLRLNGRRKGAPFGGIQMIFIGDLYQIPPVLTSRERAAFAGRYSTPYFFSSEAFREHAFEFVELEKVYRQKDAAFLELLNAVRNNTVTPGHLASLNRRTDPAFEPPEGGMDVTLTPTNAAADAINAARLARLPGSEKRYRGAVKGKVETAAVPAPLELALKPRAQVMMVSNDPGDRWVNGTMGRVSRIRRDGGEDLLEVKLADGNVAEVLPHTWKMFRYTWDAREGKIGTETTGSYTQYPLRLAWAVTIHKSQGKTFDRVIVDMGRGAFTGGQTYVALSRCTSFEGLVLRRPLRKSDILVDWRIVKFMTSLKYERAHAAQSVEEIIGMIRDAIRAGKPLEIAYLKSSDEASQRVVEPLELGEMKYLEKPFMGLKAHCRLRNDERVFRVDRILRVSPCEPAEDGRSRAKSR